MNAEIAEVENRILTLRNKQVMIDRDLAELYGVETKVLNQAVKRNIERFPEEFMFQLTSNEYEILRSQNVTTKEEKRGGRKYLPYAFTEQGVAMLSGVLRSETAVKVSIQIMKAFVVMRHFIQENAQVFAQIENINVRLLEHDEKFRELFDKMNRCGIEQKQGIFFQGQIFDAYSFFQKIIQSAEREIVLIDNYVDLSVLDRFSQKKSGVDVIIYTQKNSLAQIDVQKFNEQYPKLTVKNTSRVHDRFLILDGKKLYHIGASLKDLGKKCFGFEFMDDSEMWIEEILKNI